MDKTKKHGKMYLQSGNGYKKSRGGRSQMKGSTSKTYSQKKISDPVGIFFTWLCRLSSSFLSLICQRLSRFPSLLFSICDLLSWISLPSLNIFWVWSVEWCPSLWAAVSQLDYSTSRVFIVYSPKISRWLLTSWPDMSEDVSFFVTLRVCDKKKQKSKKT